MTVFARSIVFFCAAVLAPVLLSGCSGGEDSVASGDVTTDTTNSTASTGSVSLLLKDKPTEDFDRINITVNAWQLLGAGDAVTLSDTVETFDLLSLQNAFDVVVAAVDVPVGSYSKIRLDVARVELVDLDNDGNVIATEYPKLPSGKIDFVFNGDLVVAPNSTLVLKIDMEADNSIQYHATGNDRYIFRPVVKIEVLADAADALIRLGGIVFDRQAAPDAEKFALCNVGAVVATPDCTRIHVDRGTTFLDADMTPSDYAALNDGDEIMLFGRYDAHHGAVDAIRVLQQSYDVDGYARLIALTADFGGPVVAGRAPLVTSSDSIHVPAGTSLDSDLSNALIASPQGVIVGEAAIDAGVGAEVFGVLLPDNSAPAEIRAGFVLLIPTVVP